MQRLSQSTATPLEAVATHSTVPQPAARSTPKVAYTTPVLTTYGTVGELTMATSGSNTDGLGGNTIVIGPSDPRVKENIVRIGQHSLGIGLYLFDYKPELREQWGRGRQFGVMADEVEAVLPEAVSTHVDGYKVVNYRLLGINRMLN
ncbi:MAG: tail fiber domain-containing protein [Caldilinea sp. CFX5]|nr:tail fiber domain-containing protein [Caldilinea sp. CFX5]